MPLHKDPRWLWETIENWLKMAEKKLKGPTVPEFMKIMIDMDLYKEFRWLRDVLQDVGSPVVFCHNDMQEGNILLMEDDLKNNNGERRLVLIGEYHKHNSDLLIILYTVSIVSINYCIFPISSADDLLSNALYSNKFLG